MIECKIYNLEQLKSTLHISKRVWEERKEELLEWMKFYFDYEITLKGRTYQFHIREQYQEWRPLPKKSKVPEIKAFYEGETDHILQYKPRNTGANIAREISCYNNKYEHAKGTMANYIRPYLKTNYIIDDRQWCEIDYQNCIYKPIPEDQINFLKKQFNKYLSSADTADIISDIEAGYTSKEEGYEKLHKNYNNAMLAFYDKYGFRPYKAGQLRKKAFEEED